MRRIIVTVRPSGPAALAGLAMIALAGCGGGASAGGAAVAPATATPLAVERVVLRGTFTATATGTASPGTVAVLVDGAPATIVGTTWSHPVDLVGSSQEVAITLMVGGAITAQRVISVDR